MVAGLPADSIFPFLGSLRSTSYRGRIGLVVARMTPEDLATLGSLVDFLVPVDDRYPEPAPAIVIEALRWLRGTRGLRRAYPRTFTTVARMASERAGLARWERLECALEGLQALRYRHYCEILSGQADDADCVMLTDLRDVLFQSDPFERQVAELELFLEEPTVTIGSEPFNRRWIMDLYGQTAFEQLEALTVSCSGTVIGRRYGILHYLAQMTSAISWRRQPLGSHDQGVHNWLLRSGRLPRASVIANGEGRVLTMGAMTRVDRQTDGFVLNRDGSPAEILHQYDRHPVFATELRHQFAAPFDGEPSTSIA